MLCKISWGPHCSTYQIWQRGNRKQDEATHKPPGRRRGGQQKLLFFPRPLASFFYIMHALDRCEGRPKKNFRSLLFPSPGPRFAVLYCTTWICVGVHCVMWERELSVEDAFCLVTLPRVPFKLWSVSFNSFTVHKHLISTNSPKVFQERLCCVN